MIYRVIPAHELNSDLIDEWALILKNTEFFHSPYFRPEFTTSVASVRSDVYIGLLIDGNRTVGFFPHHNRKGGLARPIGLGLSDYQGVIVEPGVKWSPEELIRSCKINRLDFDHLIVSQKQFSPHHDKIYDSPIIDLSGGMDDYEKNRDSSGRKQLREIRRKAEKITTEKGPISFSLQSGDEKSLKQMMKWKSEQCQKTGTIDYFSFEWCRKLVEHIHDQQNDNFGGMLSTIYVGDSLAAVHFGMYTKQVWHYWLPAYNHDLEIYSPGSILLLELLKAACENKIEYIDLGKGISSYKKRVMTGTIRVAEGSITVPSLRNNMRQVRKMAEIWGKQSILKPLIRFPGKIIINIESKRRFK